MPSDPRKTSEEKWECLKHWNSLEYWTWKSIILGWWQGRSKFVPTRLLYITYVNSSEHVETYVRVVHSAELTIPITRYVALSHRWGPQTEACRTTKGDIHKRIADFSVTELTPVFRDAIEVTNRLGYQYLWIDSLCIIQDDPEDWRKESAQMQDVYTQADLVIAAHFANDNSDGFLAKSMSRRRPIGSFPWGAGRIYIDDGAPGPLDLMGSPLAFRGWIMQERQLARRTIHFFERGIWLETSNGILAEDDFQAEKSTVYRWFKYLVADGRPFFDARPDIPFAPGSFGLMDALCFFNSFDDSLFVTMYSDAFGELEPVRFLIYWLNMIEQYSRCQLTKSEDKLIAISGLARVIHNKMGLTYLAGTWVPLVSSLLWLPESRSLTPSTANRAPSWSWAAYDGPIQFVRPLLLDGHGLEFISVNGEPIPEFPETGLFCQGPLSLQIEAFVMSLSTIRIVQAPYDWPASNEKPEICSLYTHVSFELHVFTCDDDTKGWICFDVPPDDAARNSPLLDSVGFWEAANPDFCFVQLASLFTDENHRFQGIYVVGAEVEGEKVYRRIGMGEIDVEPPKGLRWTGKDTVEAIDQIEDAADPGKEGSAAQPSVCGVRTITLI